MPTLFYILSILGIDARPTCDLFLMYKHALSQSHLPPPSQSLAIVVVAGSQCFRHEAKEAAGVPGPATQIYSYVLMRSPVICKFTTEFYKYVCE